MSSSSINPSDGESRKRRYVFLVAPGEHPSPALLELLQRRGEHPEAWIQADHPLTALAHVACLERDRQLQARWYPEERFQTILVVVNRDSFPDLEPLFLTLQEFMRAVGIWVCTERLAIEIHPGEPDDERGDDDPGDDDRRGETSTSGPPAEPLLPTPEPPAPGPSEEFSDENLPNDEDIRVTEAELRDLLDLYDSNLPEPHDEPEDREGEH